jgi:hypothetical protein
MGETRKELLLAVYTVFAQARQERGLLASKVRLNSGYRRLYGTHHVSKGLM